MAYTVIVFGVFLILAGVSLLLKPQFIFGILRSNLENVWLYVGAILVRLALGYLLISAAGISKYPAVITAIGWIGVIAAVVFLAIGLNRFRKLMSWVISVWEPYGRPGGIGSVLFGIFLIVAFL